MNTTTCYCCDNPAVGQGDHVPPKRLFEKGIFSSVKPIIVPSCKEHNEEKSEADEYLKFVLSSSSRFVPSDVLGSTIRGLVRHIKKDSKNLPDFGIERTGNEVSLDGSAPIKFELLNEALKKIARGVYYHYSNGEKKLLGQLAVAPIFLGIDPSASPEERERLINVERLNKQDMETYEVHGSFKDFFSYQVIEDSETLTINMSFYGEKNVSVFQIEG